MPSMDWAALTSGVAVVVWVAAVVRSTLRGAHLHQAQRWRFVCPDLHEPVEVRLVQDVRTGQWTGVTACSALDPITCGQQCVRLLNLGFTLPGATRVLRTRRRR
jgi:hypothetical protein